MDPNPTIYDVVQEYSYIAPGTSNEDLTPIVHDGAISVPPGWCLAVVRLSKPLTYSRRHKGSVGNITSGAFERRETPLIISDDCIGLNITRPKGSHIKQLSATIKSSANFLSANVVLPGDWLLAWCHNCEEDTAELIENLKNNKPVNYFDSGLKFIGRVYSIRKKLFTSQHGVKTVAYSINGVGFQELDTQFFYDVHLATMMNITGKNNLPLFMKQIGLDWTSFVSSELFEKGKVKDNMSKLIPALVDAVIGHGASNAKANKPITDMYQIATGGLGIKKNEVSADGYKARLVTLQEDAPYAYMMPVTVAQMLGKTVVDKSRPTVFGYSDILHLLIGVQEYDKADSNTLSRGFWPVLKRESTSNRSYCKEHVKGTFIPIQEGTFINRPLWQLLQQFLNPAINEMYTALKPGPDGNITPTVVVRQIPFNTQVAEEDNSFKLARFLELPRWRIDPVMVRGLDVGRDDSTHFNMVKLQGDFALFSQTDLVNASKNEIRNPPVYDDIDIGRSGLKAFFQVVNGAPEDAVRPDGFRVWTEAVADRVMGSQFTLNGVVECIGIQSPIAEGDNIELEGIVYHIEGITDNCGLDSRGNKYFTTSLALSNGMPAKQDVSEDFPRYAGFSLSSNEAENSHIIEKTFSDNALTDLLGEDTYQNMFKDVNATNVKYVDEVSGNDEDTTSLNPGMTQERK